MDTNEYEIMFAFETSYWWYRGLQELVESCIRRRFLKTSKAPLSILDAGCGAGRMMERALPYGTVEGFDFSPEAMKFCAQRGLNSVWRQDLNTWIPPQEKYDVIISLDVLCHRSILDERDVHRKFLSALKPGGILILNLPAFELLKRNHDKAVHTQRRYAKKPTIHMLEKAGFRVSLASYRLPHFFAVMLVKKILERLFPVKAIGSDLKRLPGWLNGLLLFVNRIENALVFAGISFPCGGSVFIVGKK